LCGAWGLLPDIRFELADASGVLRDQSILNLVHQFMERLAIIS